MHGLVFGADGQLGAELVRLLGSEAGIGRREVSVTDAAAVEAAIAERRPDVVFNCAAYNAVDRAEAEPAAARAVNTEGAWHVALACARHGAGLVHFSTNFVFDGLADRPYVETDQPAPLGAYATSKLEGERRVLESHPQALVVRTAALFGGFHGSSFPERILDRAERVERLRVVSDQRINPTYTRHLAEAALGLGGGGMTGVIHLVAEECCAWDELARAVLVAVGVAKPVDPVLTQVADASAPRPRNGCLGSVRVPALPSWRDGLREWAARRRAAGL